MTITISSTKQIRQYHVSKRLRAYLLSGILVIVALIGLMGYHVADLHSRLSKQAKQITLIRQTKPTHKPTRKPNSQNKLTKCVQETQIPEIKQSHVPSPQPKNVVSGFGKNSIAQTHLYHLPKHPILPHTSSKPKPPSQPAVHQMLMTRIAQLKKEIKLLRAQQRSSNNTKNLLQSQTKVSASHIIVGDGNLSDPFVGMLLARQAQRYHLFSPLIPQKSKEKYCAITLHTPPAKTSRKRTTQTASKKKTLIASRQKSIVKKLSKTYGVNKSERKVESFFRNKNRSVVSNIALSQLGKHYVWGAVGPRTFDCSGFTSYVYRKLGINIPRTSRRQAEFGKLIRFNQLRSGDLVFFDTSRQRRGFVNHVGIYLGNNKFIHASSARHKVIITSINKTFYRQRFKWARRVN
jgi:cell wall-associated NlpC family hydrolase